VNIPCKFNQDCSSSSGDIVVARSVQINEFTAKKRNAYTGIVGW